MGLADSVLARLPAINGDRFRQGLALTTGRRKAEGYVWPLLDQIGPERFTWMMTNAKPLRDYLQPELVAWVQANAPQWKRVADAVSDTDALQLLPPWLVELAGGSEKGQQWLQGELDWLRSLFEGGSHE